MELENKAADGENKAAGTEHKTAVTENRTAEPETKADIRRRILRVRNGLSQAQRERASILLTERILGHQWYYLSEMVLLYASFGSEIGTGELIAESLRKGKKVFLPKVEGERMSFYRIHAMEDVAEGYQGIPEPSGETERYRYSERNAEQILMIMPGAAFDGRRNRIGYGKGFYDRFLADKPALQLRTIAVGYRCQLVEEIPAGEQDIRPYQVICV